MNDDLVTYITDWSKNNYIQNDRYRPSIYKELLVKMNDVSVADTGCIHDVSILDTQDRLGKDRLGKSIEDTDVSSCAEPETGSTPPFIGLPLNDGTEYGVTEEQCREWSELYPAVDVFQQLRQMRGWLLSNKERRKTKRGISRFITNWLAREQDRGRGGRSDGERRETHGAVSSTGGGQGQPAKKWGVPVVEL